MPVLEEIYGIQKKTGKVFTPSEIVWELGKKINNKESQKSTAVQNVKIAI